MNLILTLLFLIALAVVGKYAFQKIPVDNLIHNFLNYSGFYYLILGVLLGPYLLNVFTKDVINQSYFVFSLVLGWTGFLIGLQLNFKQIRRFRSTYYFKGFIYFLINLVVILTLLYGFNYLIIKNLSLLEMLLLSVAGSMTSTITISLLVKTKKFDVKSGHFLEFLAAFDNVLGVLALGILFAAFQFSTASLKEAILFLASAYLMIFLFALIYRALSKEIISFETELLVILALILIVVAVSKILQNSVLFLSAMLGIIVANLKGVNIKKLYLAVQEWEKPLNFILLFFIGIILQFKNVFLMTILFLIIVTLGNLITERIVLRKISKQLGLHTFGLSAVSLAIALDAYLSGARVELLTLVAIIFFLSNIISIYYVNKTKAKAE